MVKTLTYAQLRHALARLGFVEHPIPGGIVFWEEQTRTRLTLPEMPPDAPLLARHLSVTRALIIKSGVAEAADFERALEMEQAA
jgi:hypothetical protein